MSVRFVMVPGPVCGFCLHRHSGQTEVETEFQIRQELRTEESHAEDSERDVLYYRHLHLRECKTRGMGFCDVPMNIRSP